VRSAILFVAALCLAACSPPVVARYAPAPLNHDSVTRLEITHVVAGTQNAYSALEQLRPLFLTTRPSSALVHGDVPRIHVFINDFYAGNDDVLKTIPIASIESVRRVQSSMMMATMGEVRPGDTVLMVQLK
jgi:hypothetical protein